MNISSAINLLRHFGIDLDKLEPEKMTRLMQITQQINDPSQITPEIISEIGSMFELNNQNVNQNVLNQNVLNQNVNQNVLNQNVNQNVLNQNVLKQNGNQNVLNQNGKNIKTKIKIGRNEPCPCESGKKWKNCCM